MLDNLALFLFFAGVPALVFGVPALLRGALSILAAGWRAGDDIPREWRDAAPHNASCKTVYFDMGNHDDPEIVDRFR